jgi:hypothetical protein
VVVVDEELALGEVEGVGGESLVFLPQGQRDLVGLLVLVVAWEEDGLVLVTLLELLALPAAVLNDLVDEPP